jgi:rod shape-determining protein MreC
MTPLLASRQARRRGITFTILVAITLLLMAFSANPYVREFQNGLTFALRPFQGAIAGAAESVAGVAGALGEIDRLRGENVTLRDENERLRNEQLTALVQLQSGLDHATVATRVIGRETLDTRRVVILDKGTDDGIEEGDVLIVQGGALAGRVTDTGPNFAKATLISDSASTVVGQLSESGKSGEVTGQAGGVLVMRNIDSAVPIAIDEEVFTAGIEVNAGIRSPYPKGLVIGSVVDVQRDANAVVQTAFLAPAADLDSFELGLVITDYQGGLPDGDAVPVPCGTGQDGTLPDGEVPCYTPTPRPATPRPTPKG